ncbi:MAG: hypothetical protein ACJAS6_000121 [Rickettsiales bacterium]|jgi:hypothetical protein
MLLIDYIKNNYGEKRGNKAKFLRDNPKILPQELNRWINAELKVNLKTGEIYKPTSKQINAHEKVAIEKENLSEDTLIKLKASAKNVNMDCDQFINYLLEDEIHRNQLLSDVEGEPNIGNEKIETPIQAISEVINHYFSSLTHLSEDFEFQTALEELLTELLKKKLLNLKVPKNMIAESDRLKMSRKTYYWHGSVIAKNLAMMFGADDIYLWHPIYNPDSEIVFVGAPNNVVACYLICEKLCKIFKKIRSDYVNGQGAWGSKKDIEESANQYVHKFAKGIITFDVCIYDEDSQMRLIKYAGDKYSYAMD